MPRVIKVPSVKIEHKAIDHLPLEVEDLGSLRLLVVSGKNTFEVAGSRAAGVLKSSGFPTESLVLDHAGASIVHVHTIRQKLREGNFDTVVAVGGGSIIDMSKLAAAKEGKELIVVPTALSHDGIASPLASIPMGSAYRSHPAVVPSAIIADLEILMNSPAHTLAAGCGDLVAKISAHLDWRLAHEEKGEEFDEVAVSLTRLPAEYVVHAAKAIRDRRPTAIRLVVRGLVVSGLALELVGSSRPVSGSEHKFSHSLDRIANRPAPHGHQVGIGTIISLYLHEEHWERVREALDIIGAPTTSKQLGITKESAVKALVNAPKIRPGRYTILEHLGIDERTAQRALKETDVI